MTARSIGEVGLQVVPELASDFESKLVGKMKSIATDGLKRLAQASVTAAVASAKSFGSYEKTLSRIEGLVGVNREQVDKWKEDIKGIAEATAVGPQELAEAMFFITSAGLEGAEALEALEFSAKAATAGLGDTATIADVVTSAMNAYKDAGLTAGQATDILVGAVREGKLESDQLAGALGRVLPIAAELDVPLNDVAAAVAAMSRTGLDANEAVTALRGVLGTLLNPAAEAKTVLAEFGLSADEVRRKLADEGLLGLLKDLQTRFEGNDEATSAVFGNVRALTGVLSLVGDETGAVAGIFDALNDSLGDTEEAFGVAADTGAFKFEQAMTRIKVILLEAGEEALPAILDIIEELAPQLGELLPQIIDMGVELIKAGADAAPVFIELIGYITELATWIGWVVDIAQAAGGDFDGLYVRLEPVARKQIEITERLIDFANRVSGFVAGGGVGQIFDGSEAAASGGRRLGEALDDVKGGLRGVDPRLRDLQDNLDYATRLYELNTDAAEDNAVAQHEVSEEAQAVRDAIADSVLPFDTATQSSSNYATALGDALAAQESLALAVLTSTDPIAKAARAVQDLAEYEAQLAEEGDTSAASQFKLYEKLLLAQGALDGLGEAELLSGISAIAQTMGMTVSETEDFLTQLGILDGKNVKVVVDVFAPKGITIGDARVPIKVIGSGRNPVVANARGGVTEGAKDEISGLVHGSELVFPAPSNDPGVYAPFAEALSRFIAVPDDVTADTAGVAGPFRNQVLLVSIDSSVVAESIVDPFVDELELQIGDRG